MDPQSAIERLQQDAYTAVLRALKTRFSSVSATTSPWRRRAGMMAPNSFNLIFHGMDTANHL